RQYRGQSGTKHLAVDLMGKILFRAVRKNLAAAAPQRTRGHPRTRPSCAFLAPGFARGFGNVAAALLCTRTQAPVCHIGRHDLMYERLVVFAAKQFVRRLYAGGGLTLCVDQLQFHHALAFTEGCTTRSPPSEPGTAPLMSSS